MSVCALKTNLLLFDINITHLNMWITFHATDFERNFLNQDLLKISQMLFDGIGNLVPPRIIVFKEFNFQCGRYC